MEGILLVEWPTSFPQTVPVDQNLPLMGFLYKQNILHSYNWDLGKHCNLICISANLGVDKNNFRRLNLRGQFIVLMPLDVCMQAYHN